MSDQYIEVDDSALETSSDYEHSGSEVSTESLASSIYEYRYENGRRYHAFRDGNYTAPNDEQEQDRLDIVHHVCCMMLGGELHIAPIGKHPHKILDIGTGTGIWAIDCAEHYPSAEVIGTDLSPIQPSWVPPNVQFQIDDAECEWTWPKNSFDMVHMRHLAGAIKDWGFLLKQAYNVTKPGSWLDMCEYDMILYSDDGTYHEGTAIWEYEHLVNKAADTTGRNFKVASSMEPLLKGAGFENITHKVVKMPLGTWPADPKQREIGAFFLLIAETGFEALGLALMTRVLGMSVGDANDLIKRCKKEGRGRKVHVYVKMNFYCAQKPGGE